MKKAKITANGVLEIVKSIMADEEVNIVIDDPKAPAEWAGKRILEILDTEFYAFSHRPATAEQLALEIISLDQSTANGINGENRSFALLDLINVERTFAKNLDKVSLTANIEFWTQSEKVQLLAYLFEGIASKWSGLRFNVDINGDPRQCVTSFDNFNVAQVNPEEFMGEASVVGWTITMILQPPCVSYADYKVEIYLGDYSLAMGRFYEIPVQAFQIISSMTQKALPYSTAQFTSSINLSNAKGFMLTFDGYDNEFVDFLCETSFNMGNIWQEEEDTDDDVEPVPQPTPANNGLIMLRLNRKDKAYLYECVIKDHTVTLQNDVGNEVHNLILAIRGIN